MHKHLYATTLASLLAPAVVAQTIPPWVQPANCPASLRTMARNTQLCPSQGCTISVRVSPPTASIPCVARIQNGDFHVEKNSGPDRPIKWQIVASSCSASQCTFHPSTGVEILKDPDNQMDAKSHLSPLVYQWKDRNSVSGAYADYEPHVMWRKNPQSPYQSCCAIDPKITND